MRVLAIIPARKGSKGLPRKNLLPLAGKPLVAHSILAAQEAERVDRVMVSTDDEEVMGVARELGAEVPFARPAELADDQTTTTEVCLHALEHLKADGGDPPDAVLLLQPTSPLRSAADIDAAVDLLVRTGASSVIGLREVGEFPEWMKCIDQDLRLSDKFAELQRTSARQDLEKSYIVSGAIYLVRTESFESTRSFYGGDARGFVMPAERTVDIDTEIDFKLAELLISDREERGEAR